MDSTHNDIIKDFIKSKDIPNNKILDESSIVLFNKIYGNDQYIIKNNVKIDRNKLDNKIIVILNKLTDKNIDNIILEFIKNVNKLNIEEFELFQKLIYTKIISEIRYVDSYLKFLITINKIYSDVCNTNIKYFCNVVEYSFRLYYCNYILFDKYDFINSDENTRSNNNTLIKKMVEYNLFKNDIIDICGNNILNNNKYIVDIYHWFNNITITDEHRRRIKEKCNNTKDTRESILLKKLL